MANKVNIDVDIQTGQADRKLNQQKAKLKEFENFVSKIGGVDGGSVGAGVGLIKSLVPATLALAPLIAATATAKVGFDGLRSAMDLGAELQNMSSQTGMSVGYLSMIKTLLAESGVDAASLAAETSKMSKYLWTAAQVKGGGRLLGSIGIDLNKIENESPSDQFKKIGEAINSIENPTKRAAFAMEIFGKNGAELLKIFASPEFKNSDHLSEVAKILDANAAAFKEAKAKLQAILDDSNSGFFSAMESQILPKLNEKVTPGVQTAINHPIISLGRGIGSLVGTAINHPFDASNTIQRAGGIAGWMGMKAIAMGGMDLLKTGHLTLRGDNLHRLFNEITAPFRENSQENSAAALRAKQRQEGRGKKGLDPSGNLLHPEAFADSFRKIGAGGFAGAQMQTGDPILEINKQQLQAQKDTVKRLDDTVKAIQTLKLGGGSATFAP